MFIKENLSLITVINELHKVSIKIVYKIYLYYQFNSYSLNFSVTISWFIVAYRGCYINLRPVLVAAFLTQYIIFIILDFLKSHWIH